MEDYIEKLELLAELDGIEEYRSKFDYYSYNNIGVPRTTQIIKQATDQTRLINWAMSCNYNKAKNIRDKATKVGTVVHEKIENYLKYLINGSSDTEDLYLPIEDFLPSDYCKAIDTAYNNFKYWINRINCFGIRIEDIYATELTITTPWYGGTIDCIMKINGAWYIVDFKTSSYIDYSYLIQAAAYMWATNNNYYQSAPHIDGIGIIRVDKNNKGKFDDLFLNNFKPEDARIIDQYQKCFFSYLETYYRNINVNYISSQYIHNYDIKNVLEDKREWKI